MTKDTVKSRAPACLDSCHRGCSCVTPPFLIPNSLGISISTFRAKEQRSMSYDKGPITFRMKGIFSFSTNDRRAWNILPFPKSPTQGEGLFILHIHYRHIHSSVLSITFQSTTSNGVDLTYFPIVRDIPLTPNCIPQLAPQTQSQIPNSPFQIRSRRESTATPMFGTLCGEVIT